MVLFYSGGDAGVRYHPEVLLGRERVSVMLSFVNLTGAAGYGRKSLPRFRQWVKRKLVKR